MLKSELKRKKKIKKKNVLVKEKKSENNVLVKEKKSENNLLDASNFWNTNLKSLRKPVAEAEVSSDDEPEEERFKKKRRLTQREKLKIMNAEEERLRQLENDFANVDKPPESPDDFDRLVLASPNNSLLWIKYMVYHLQATEMDKARNIARRALKVISFREEEEKLNIWAALFNLEIRYGSIESFNEVFKEALIVNDQFKVYSRAFEVLSDSKKIEQLTELALKASRKFGNDPMTWEMIATSYFKVGLVEKAKQQLSFALNRLEKKQHVNLIIRFAALNNEYDQTETSYALFDQILASYPIRVDVWSRYVDILVKRNKIDLARQLLERGISQKIKAGSIRKIYNKYIDFEEKNGDPKNIPIIKERAAAYVNSKLNLN